MEIDKSSRPFCQVRLEASQVHQKLRLPACGEVEESARPIDANRVKSKKSMPPTEQLANRKMVEIGLCPTDEQNVGLFMEYLGAASCEVDAFTFLTSFRL
jgi:hypothetical protein